MLPFQGNRVHGDEQFEGSGYNSRPRLGMQRLLGFSREFVSIVESDPGVLLLQLLRYG
jgi:hypothetical protein